MKLLNVIFDGWGERWPLGVLAESGGDILFEYAPEALRRGIEFSPRHLPLRPDGFSGFPPHQHRLPGLVADALPDGWGMLLMDKLMRKQGRASSSISPLDRLAFIGARGMGALLYVPADPAQLAPEERHLLDLAQAAQSILQGKDSALLKQLMQLGGAPHGSRPKVLVRLDPASGRISTLDDATWGQPWLIKFPARGEHKEVCAIEHVYAELARRCGLEVPATHHFDLDRRLAAFGTHRFDREDGMRVPVHTLAGLLQVDAGFRRCVFNVLFHNRDDHARNFSYRMSRAWHWRLAPCYDLGFNSGPGGEHQMAVMGERRAPGLADLKRRKKKA